MIKYREIVRLINHSVTEFNLLLSDNFQIELLDDTRIKDEAYFLCVNDKEWNEYSFPRNREVGGVYFYFGFKINEPDKLCLYIGKASFSRTLGQRLWSHFYYMKQSTFNEKKCYIKDDFVIELITSIPLENEGTVVLASALEEFLISKLRTENIILLNSVGNY